MNGFSKPAIRPRNIALDSIRTIAVVSAIWIHANHHLLLPGNLIPHGFNQRVAYIGYVFAFAGGYIAAVRYLKLFEEDAWKTTLKMIFKGLKLLGILAGYVYTMSRIRAEPIVDYWELIYPTRYMNRALGAFGLMYIGVPLLLQARVYLKHSTFSLVLAIATLSLGTYSMTEPGMPSMITALLFDYRNNLYPVMFMLGAYMLGMWWGETRVVFTSKRINPMWRIGAYAIVSTALIAWRPQINSAASGFAAWQLVAGSMTLACLTYLLESLFEIIPPEKVPTYLTVPGKNSLVYYMAGNAVIDLVYIRPEFQWNVNGWGTMLVTLSIAYALSAIWPIRPRPSDHSNTTSST